MAFISNKDITDKEFYNALDSYLITITKEAHPYTSKNAILEQLLDKCSNILSIDLNWHQSKNMIQIHPDNMLKIDEIWQKLNRQEIKTIHEEENVYKILKNSNYIHILDIQKMITLLINKNEKQYYISLLAIDGFYSNLKKYIENLKIGNDGNTHIHIIKYIYKTFPGCTVRIIFFILLHIFIRFANDDEIKQLVQNTICEFKNKLDENENNFLNWNMEKITHFYMNQVENIESVALLKLAQLKIKNKKGKKK